MIFFLLFPGKTQFRLIIQKKNWQDLAKCYGFLRNVKKKCQDFWLVEEWIHYEKKLTKNIRPTDILQIYTSI